MNKTVALFALLILGSAVNAPAFAQTKKPVTVVQSLRFLRANAVDAGKNATIYQWMRVNREVDRIAVSEKAVSRAFAADAASTNALQSLHQAVIALRAGRLNHDVERIREAAQQIIADCDALLK